MAFRALAPLRNRRILSLARQALLSSGCSATVRAAAVEPWKAAGGPDSVRLLLAAAVSADSSLRAAIADALESMPRREETEVLLACRRTHREPSIRALVAGALGRADHPEVIRSLEEALRDESQTVRLAAVASLGHRPEAAADRLLQEKARSPSVATAVAAVDAMAGRDAEGTLACLAGLAVDERPDIRVARSRRSATPSCRRWPGRTAAATSSSGKSPGSFLPPGRDPSND